jgi:hypothetical protein
MRELFGAAQTNSEAIQYAREQRDRDRRERSRSQRERNALADAKRKADLLITSAKNVSIDHWTDAFLSLSLERLADAYELIGDHYGGD